MNKQKAEEHKEHLLDIMDSMPDDACGDWRDSLAYAIEALKQEPIDKSAMLYEIYMEGVNMAGEYQGCWVRFKDIEKIVDKYMAESEDKE